MNNRLGIQLDQLCRTAMRLGVSKGGSIETQYLSEKDGLEKGIEKLESEISRLTAELADKDEEIARLKATLTSEYDARVWAEERLKNAPCVVDEHATLRNQLEEAEKVIDLVIRKVMEAQREITTLRNQLEEAEKVIESMHKYIDHYHDCRSQNGEGGPCSCGFKECSLLLESYRLNYPKGE